MKCGSPPIDLGLIDLSPTEMMFWLYCPISQPDSSKSCLPDNLFQFIDIVDAVRAYDRNSFHDNYVYLTAKTLFVSGDYVGNRPGWHTDGFGTDDVNFIWYDRAPTEFITGNFNVSIGCDLSMAEMEVCAQYADKATFPAKHLLRLDQRVIHRSPVGFEAGMRTFVKVSVSRDRYDLAGNSINHDLTGEWQMIPRRVERNHPASKQAGYPLPSSQEQNT